MATSISTFAFGFQVIASKAQVIDATSNNQIWNPKTKVEYFYELELIFNWSGHFTCSEHGFGRTNLHKLKSMTSAKHMQHTAHMGYG